MARGTVTNVERARVPHRGFDMKHLRLLALTSCGLFAAYGGLVACSDDTVITDTPTEAGTDAPDTGTDAPPDTGADVDAGPPPSATQFAQNLAEAMCGSLSRCCYGAAVDAGTPVDGG